MKFLIHIGVNKTGTSSLQSAFSARRTQLSEQGILYPETGLQQSAHHQLSRVAKGARPASLGLSDNWADDLRAEFKDHELCVLSSENFATLRDVRPMTEICPPGDTRVVVYLRDYARYMTSWYQQAIHSRNISFSLEDFIDNYSADFSTIVRLWREVYGSENVEVRQYDRANLKDGDIVADFCDMIRPGLEDTFAGIKHSSNPSLTGNLLMFKRMLNCFITREESLQVASELANMADLDPTFSGKLAVPEETVARIRYLSREDSKAIKAETGLDLTPRMREIKGHPSPDLTRLEQDMHLIRDAAVKREFQVVKFLERMRGLSPLAHTG